MKKLKQLWERAKYVTSGEDGASALEIIVWISVVLVIATALFFFRDSIVNFLGRARNSVDNFQINTHN